MLHELLCQLQRLLIALRHSLLVKHKCLLHGITIWHSHNSRSHNYVLITLTEPLICFSSIFPSPSSSRVLRAVSAPSLLPLYLNFFSFSRTDKFNCCPGSVRQNDSVDFPPTGDCTNATSLAFPANQSQYIATSSQYLQCIQKNLPKSSIFISSSISPLPAMNATC